MLFCFSTPGRSAEMTFAACQYRYLGCRMVPLPLARSPQNAEARPKRKFLPLVRCAHNEHLPMFCLHMTQRRIIGLSLPGLGRTRDARFGAMFIWTGCVCQTLWMFA